MSLVRAPALRREIAPQPCRASIPLPLGDRVHTVPLVVGGGLMGGRCSELDGCRVELMEALLRCGEGVRWRRCCDVDGVVERWWNGG